VSAGEARSLARDTAHRAAGDAKALATAPLRWRAHEWQRFSAGVALVLAVHAADGRLLDAVQRNGGSGGDAYLRHVTHLGGGTGQQLALAMLAGGWLAHDPKLRDTGAEALESAIWASGIVSKSMKVIVGRERPDHSDHQSFPSGHATQAFAIATAISARYGDRPVVPIIAYTLATSVAFARVHDNVHFPSDVVAGALIGRAVAKSIHNRHVHVIPGRRALLVHVTF
jgi:membrane-associated phospholipid phosphatase